MHCVMGIRSRGEEARDEASEEEVESAGGAGASDVSRAGGSTTAETGGDTSCSSAMSCETSEGSNAGEGEDEESLSTEACEEDDQDGPVAERGWWLFDSHARTRGARITMLGDGGPWTTCSARMPM